MRDYESKRRVPVHDQTLEQQAVSIINVALADHLDPTSGSYVAPETDNPCIDDPENCGCETLIYVAPETDPA